MKTNILTNTINTREKESFISNIKASLISGVYGYFLFLSILLITKSLSSYIIKNISLEFESTDFILPLIGFVLTALIKFLENYKTEENI